MKDSPSLPGKYFKFMKCKDLDLNCQFVSVMMSGLSLSGIALDRYNAVSLNKNKDILPTVITILGIDLFAIIMAIIFVKQ